MLIAGALEWICFRTSCCCNWQGATDCPSSLVFSEMLFCYRKIEMAWGLGRGNCVYLWTEDRNWVPLGEPLCLTGSPFHEPTQ